MDPATAAGLGLGFVLILVVDIMEGGSIASLFLPAPMLLVFGVTIAVCMAGATMIDVKAVVPSIIRAMTAKLPKSQDIVPTIVSLAERARREGLLALEEDLKSIDDPFLVKGMSMAIDGTDPEELRELMEAEVDAKRQEDFARAKFFTDAGGYAPTIGIIGTVMSLVHVLSNLSDPEKLGEMISSAFIATLWGVLSANVIWLPVAQRLKRISQLEIEQMEVVIEGVSAIQAGSNPRIIAQKLNTLLRVEENVA